jgi:phenylacetate-CoA ligase
LIKENFKALSSDRLHTISHNQSNTGGSTGEPLEFLITNLVGAVDGIHQRFQFKLMGYEKNDLICGFGGMSVSKELREENIFWNNTKTDYADWEYSSLYLSETTFPYYVDHFLKCKPVFLRGYPSAIEAFATYIIQENILIPFAIKAVELTSENCSFTQVEKIRKAFKTRIYFQYGHSEACIFAYTTDDTFRYTCSPFYGFTEVLNEAGSHVRVGEIGEVVVTGFYNCVQPFIRYRTGDRALYGGSENGVVFLDRIEGRTQDYVLNYKKQKVFLTAITFGQHYESFRVIKKWQIVQREYGKVLFYIIPDIGFSRENEREISNKFKNIAGIDAEFVYVNNIPLNKNGKFSFLIQNLSD